MDNYARLKDELSSIAKIVGTFPDDLKPKVYDLLVSSYLGTTPAATPVKVQESAKAAPPKRGRKAARKKAEATKLQDAAEATLPDAKKATRKSGSKESWQMDRNLDLRASASAPSFKDFVEEKQPKNESEFWAVSAYYLQKLRGISPVTLNHIYTCYAEVRRKPPTAFRQALINTKNRHGWLESDEQGNVNIPHRGVVYVEHDLPSAKASKK